MKYAKPEIALVGDAAQVIQLIGKPQSTPLDGVAPFNTNPAYDLDE